MRHGLVSVTFSLPYKKRRWGNGSVWAGQNVPRFVAQEGPVLRLFDSFYFLFWRNTPPPPLDLVILEVSRSHSTTHPSRYVSSARVISSLQRPLPDNTQSFLPRVVCWTLCRTILHLLPIILFHPTDLISLSIFIACTDMPSFRIICVVSESIKNVDENRAFDITEILRVLFYVSRTKRLGSNIQGMKLFGNIILSCSFLQLFGF